ncbi:MULTISPECIES: ABC transporter ATP-binding protein [Pseudonocardia]|uniref:Daunorubicin/doxorubicin resistance ATP-binding protein DrrA n=2 Tax=Pseudonocardia TaxID=1847 RepID=A0A1Y2N1J8_PSEAH|nr:MULTISPECIES: ATP-binding cassette domain-containing protein [Pseudonocardia]OSY41069.1 Daunorubicin/doxorubicin resistance ATP-binding protein DrrA [Pseudonocardia autotrophica]TDN73804.1 ABC-2 type transport system ATP-binding protein [Pseudonocardia autotrophica]BBG04550.1 ABC transporter [Pseudonocardia autotrophica]GEC27866.1 ABC transporter [Pseudonocardia saturnea]
MIHTESLTRHFRVGQVQVEAVRGIDLDVGAGELVAFLGPNGAGKSTTLRMLTSLLPPTSGRAEVAGVDVAAHPAEVRRRIGYIGQKDGAGHNYRVHDELLMQGRFYGMSRAESTASAERLMHTLDLRPLAMRKVGSLSGGQKRRLDIALGLIHAPRLLFLDEPSTGMDPQNRANLWEHIMRIRADHGTTIVLTTHYLDEADAMAERVVIIDHGRVIADDTAERLKSEQAGDRLTVTVAAGDVPAARAVLADAIVPALTGAPGPPGPVAEVEERSVPDGHALTVGVAAAARELPAVLGRLRDAGIDVRAAESRRPTLDDVFLRLTGRSLRDGEA